MKLFNKPKQPIIRLCMIDDNYYVEDIKVKVTQDSIFCGYRLVHFISPRGTRHSFKVNWINKHTPLSKGVNGVILKK